MSVAARVIGVLWLTALSCSSAKPSSVRVDTKAALIATPGEGHAEQRLYATGAAALVSCREGEHTRADCFDAAMTPLRQAAERDHLAAQALYGREMFSNLINRASPSAEEHDDYVRALTYLRRATKRGDASAARFIPQLAALRVENGVLKGPPREMPLSEIPDAWIIEALSAAELPPTK